jgi:hypothetical protein
LNNGQPNTPDHTDRTGSPSQAIATVDNSARVQRAIELRESISQDATPRAIVPRTFAEAQSFAGAIAASSLVPDALRERAPDVLMIVLAGAELGIAPVRALSMFHVIEGVPKLSADALAAIVMASPLCEYLEPREQSDTRVVWAGKRRDRPNEITLAVTQDDIERAGLLRPSRNGSPSNHSKYPRQMKNARAKAELCRMLWPEVCAGLLTAEEARELVEAKSVEGFSAPMPPNVTSTPPVAPTPAKAAERSTAKAAAKERLKNPPPIPEEPIDVQATERPTAPAKSSSPLPPDPARDAAFDKARGAAKDLEEARRENPTTIPAPSGSAEGGGSRSTGTTSEGPSATSSDTGPIATPDDDTGFGDDPQIPARTFEAFEAALMAAVATKDPKSLDQVKADWVPWSKDEGPTGGKVHAHKMRELFAHARADLGIR